MVYLDILEMLHRVFVPQAYMEIGVWAGDSLRLSHARTVAIDPSPAPLSYDPNQFPWFKLYRMTSDEFFARHDARQVLEDAELELTFIDGLHLFDAVYRDFMHVEQWSSRYGVVVIHDVLPFHTVSAERERKTQAWTGDVWRIVPCLQELRPDLRLQVIDAWPSGLLVISNLDPGSTVLRDRETEATGRYLNDPRPYKQQVRSYLREQPRMTVEDWVREFRRNPIS